jgi:hypothetical protein
MKKNECQAYTKKRKPCKSYAMKGSQFCYVHKGLFKDFPPVKITALICPYCKESIKRSAEFCNVCKHSFLICPYCDEPLRKDDKFCSFCKFDITPEKPIPKDYDVKLTVVDKSSAAKGMSLGIEFFLAILAVLWIVAIYTLLQFVY